MENLVWVVIVMVVVSTSSLAVDDVGGEAMNTIYSRRALNAVKAENADSALTSQYASVAGVAKNAGSAMVAESALNSRYANSARRANFALKANKASFAKYAFKTENITNSTFTESEVNQQSVMALILKGMRTALGKSLSMAPGIGESDNDKREGIAYASIYATKSLNSINAVDVEKAVRAKNAKHSGKAVNSKYALAAKNAKNAMFAKNSFVGERVRRAKIAKYAMFAKAATTAIHVGTKKQLMKMIKANGDLEDWEEAFRRKKQDYTVGWEEEVYEEE